MRRRLSPDTIGLWELLIIVLAIGPLFGATRPPTAGALCGGEFGA
ncbi:MAG TPA: twin-arginine translocase TatA/TatE family subunit [Actinomycetes bacterium]